MLALLLASALLAPPPPGGLEVLDCDGAGSFFFEGGLVIHEEDSCGPAYVTEGHWRREGDAVVVRWERRWATRGVGPPGNVADCGPVYERYEAVVVTVPNSTPEERFTSASFSPPSPDECGGAIPHARPPDPHAFLRRFEGQHPDTFRRVLDTDDLKGISAKDLRLMRNEIFARYGLSFRDPALRAHFEKQLGHAAVMVEVDAFLSDIERKNVEVLAAAERAAQHRAGEVDARRSE